MRKANDRCMLDTNRSCRYCRRNEFFPFPNLLLSTKQAAIKVDPPKMMATRIALSAGSEYKQKIPWQSICMFLTETQENF
jgi:hypothetical protein